MWTMNRLRRIEITFRVDMGNKESICNGLKQFLVIVLILCRLYTYEARKKKKKKMEKWVNFIICQKS